MPVGYTAVVGAVLLGLIVLGGVYVLGGTLPSVGVAVCALTLDVMLAPMLEMRDVAAASLEAVSEPVVVYRVSEDVRLAEKAKYV